MNHLTRIWNWITLSPLGQAVNKLGPKYFSEFGYRNHYCSHNGVCQTIVLKHCEIVFCLYKDEFSCVIRPFPKHQDAEVLVDEEFLPFSWLGGVSTSRVRRKVAEQMDVIVRDYREILDGSKPRE